MAKKSTSAPSRSHLLNLFAFIAIVVCAVAWAIAFTLQLFDVQSTIVGILRTFATALMSIVTLFVAYNYVRNRKNISYHIIFWVCAIIVIVINVLIIIPF